VKASAERLCFVDHVSLNVLSCSSIGSIIALKMKFERGFPCLTPLSNETSVFDPAYSIDVLRLVYEFILDSRTPFGIPRRFRAPSMALCRTVTGLVFNPAAVFPLFRDQNRISI